MRTFNTNNSFHALLTKCTAIAVMAVWILMISLPGLAQESTTIIRDGNGNVQETTTHADGSKTTTTTTRDAKGTTTKSVVEKDKNGRETKSTTTTTDKDGKYTKETKDSANKTSSKTEGTTDAAGRKIQETTKEFGKDGKPTRTVQTEYDAGGNPTKQTEYGPDGKKTKETEWNDDSRTETEYEKDGKTKKKETKYDKDGKKISETEYKKGKPVKKTEYDENGDPIPDDNNEQGALPSGAALDGLVVMMPDQVEPGPMTFTVATLTGAVLPEQEVTLSGGSAGSMTVKTDENGQATVDVPTGWHGVRAQVLNTVATALVVRALSSGGSGKPVIQDPPPQMTPGRLVNLHGQRFSHRLAENVVTMGGTRARVVGAAPNALTVVVPNIATGRTDVQVVTNGRASDPVKTDMITMVWDPGPNTLMNHQTVTRTLRIKGTTESVPVVVTDPPTDSATSSVRGLTYSSGGENNVVQTKLSAVRAGVYSLRATLASASDAEEDRRNAEFARKDAAGWRESAKNDTDQKRKEQKQNAAGNSDRAASNWDKAADARDKGDNERADQLEQAARKREEAAREWGANGNGDAAKKAEGAAKALEDKAK